MKNLLDWQHVESSNVNAVAYHEPTQTLCVRFNSGSLYSYDGASFEVYMSLVNAQSIGKYLNNAIKNVYPFNQWDDEQALIAKLNAA